MGPTNNWKLLSDDKWVMVPNKVGCFKWWVMSDENWVMSDGWWKLCDKWPFFLTKQGLNFPPYFDFSVANISFPTPFSPSFFCFCFLLRVPHYVTLPPSFSFFFFIFICFFFLHHFVSHTPWLPLLFFLPPLSFALFFFFLCTCAVSQTPLFFFFFFPLSFLGSTHSSHKIENPLFLLLSLSHKQLSLSQPPTPPNTATVAASSPFAAASLPLLHGLTSSNLNLR